LPDLTDLEWLARLDRKLTEQQNATKRFSDYYNGDHSLSFATVKFQQTFGDLFAKFSDNWCRTVVDAPVERLAIDGFRMPNKADTKKAWKIWQDNRLDAQSILAHTEAVKTGRAYIIVEPGPNPRITVEHPSQVVVEHAAGDRRQRVAALKKWRGEDGYTYATLYLPDRIVKFRSGIGVSSKLESGLIALNFPAIIGGWEERPDDPGGDNPFDVVPVIPLYNSPTMLEEGQSDLLPAIPLNDAINKELMDMLVASEYAAFRQRILSGIQVPTIPRGQTASSAEGGGEEEEEGGGGEEETADQEQIPDPAFEVHMAVSRLIALEDKDVKVHEFAASDLGNYEKAVTLLLQHLAAQTRTPPHYLLGSIVNASGDALKAAETGLVAKVKRKQIDFADSWEEAIGLALGKSGAGIEVHWRDPEYRSEGELVDAAAKLKDVGVPLPAIWERIGASSEQIEQWQKEQPTVPPAPADTGAPTS